MTPAGSRHWPRVVFTPGAHPLREAAAALAAACPSGSPVPAEPSAGDLDVLLARAARAVWPGARAVLVVDQFEELFRLCEDEDERGAFITWLWQVARSRGPGGPAALAACAVRADFYPDCTRYPQLRQALQDNQVIVGSMSPAELREAIICPAEAAGLDIEPGLTELLLADLHAGREPAGGNGTPVGDDGAGRLPLLAHALQATWRQRHGSTLTVEGYQAAGGIEHAVAETAERVYGRLDAEAQREARGLFLRLVKIGTTGGEDIRRPLTRAALAPGGTAAAVIDAYTTPAADPVPGYRPDYARGAVAGLAAAGRLARRGPGRAAGPPADRRRRRRMGPVSQRSFAVVPGRAPGNGRYLGRQPRP